MSQEPATDEALVRPNYKYDAIFGTSYSLMDDRFREKEERKYEEERAALEDLNEEGESYPSGGENTDVTGLESDVTLTEEERSAPLTWEDFGVTTEPGHLRELATFFEGVSSSENPDSIRERILTGEPEWYANAYVVLPTREVNGGDVEEEFTGDETDEDDASPGGEGEDDQTPTDEDEQDETDEEGGENDEEDGDHE